MYRQLLICAVLCIVFSTAHSYNNRPIIGILTEPWEHEEYADRGGEYIAASYVKFMESAGARVVPISYKWNSTTLDLVFNSVNGILFPGGGVDLNFGTPYLTTLKYLFDKTKAVNDAGNGHDDDMLRHQEFTSRCGAPVLDSKL